MIKKILIDLDTLLDTRLATIRNLNPEAAKVLVRGPRYWDRIHDDWFALTDGLVTNEQFQEAWAKRGGDNTADTLNASIETGISPFLLRVLAEDSVNRADNMGDPDSFIGIEVNCHPYVLPYEVERDLHAIMTEKYGSEIQISIVNIPLEELTCHLLDTVYAMFVTYQFHDWIKTHCEELGKVRMSCFNFIGPKIFEKDPSKLTLEQQQFEFMKFRLDRLIHMDFEFIDARHMSMFLL